MDKNPLDEILAKLGLSQEQLQRMTGKDFFGPDFVMDLDKFKETQKKMHGFGFQNPCRINLDIYNSAVIKSKNNKPLSMEEFASLAFDKIFGLYSDNQDLNGAENIANALFSKYVYTRPSDTSRTNNYLEWLQCIAIPHMVMGTACAYEKKYVKASYHFLKALKTEMIAINTPYCDFIKYILEQAIKDSTPAQFAVTGFGSSWENPMGADGVMKGYLNTYAAPAIISELEGLDDEVVFARQGRSGMYGYFERRGSTRNCVDIYETFIITKEYELKKMTLFFNGYFQQAAHPICKIPKGFRIKSHSVLLGQYTFMS